MKQTRDLRKYANQTNFRLILGALFLIFVVGVGLIYFFYGPQSALMGVFCLALALVPMLLIGLMLFGLEWIVRRNQGD